MVRDNTGDGRRQGKVGLGNQVEFLEILPRSVMKTEGGIWRVLRVHQEEVVECDVLGLVEKPGRWGAGLVSTALGGISAVGAVGIPNTIFLLVSKLVKLRSSPAPAFGAKDLNLDETAFFCDGLVCFSRAEVEMAAFNSDSSQDNAILFVKMAIARLEQSPHNASYAIGAELESPGRDMSAVHQHFDEEERGIFWRAGDGVSEGKLNT